MNAMMQINQDTVEQLELEKQRTYESQQRLVHDIDKLAELRK